MLGCGLVPNSTFTVLSVDVDQTPYPQSVIKDRQPATSYRGALVAFLKKGGEKMRKRISLLFAALMMALTMSLGSVAFADPNCTGPPDDRPGACKITEKGQGKETGPPGPGKFVGPGGGASPANH